MKEGIKSRSDPRFETRKCRLPGNLRKVALRHQPFKRLVDSYRCPVGDHPLHGSSILKSAAPTQTEKAFFTEDPPLHEEVSEAPSCRES
jgi:hypothetical protein